MLTWEAASNRVDACDVETCNRGIFRVRAAREAREEVQGEAYTRAAPRGVEEDGGEMLTRDAAANESTLCDAETCNGASSG